jgi:hypothetical protein
MRIYVIQFVKLDLLEAGVDVVRTTLIEVGEVYSGAASNFLHRDPPPDPCLQRPTSVEAHRHGPNFTKADFSDRWLASRHSRRAVPATSLVSTGSPFSSRIECCSSLTQQLEPVF